MQAIARYLTKPSYTPLGIYRIPDQGLIQTPKVCLNDSGPLASLLGAAENFIKAWSRLASGEANGQKSIGLAD